MVGTSRDERQLLPGGGQLADAVARGELAQIKVRGRWLYGAPDLPLEQVLVEAERAANCCLEEWFLGTNPILSNAAAKRTDSPAITGSAMTLLVQDLCRHGALGGLGLVNRNYQPYIAFYRKSDADEVARQLATVRQLIHEHEVVDWRDLPAPEVSRPGKAWRPLLLSHAEYLGLGWAQGRWELIRW